MTTDDIQVGDYFITVGWHVSPYPRQITHIEGRRFFYNIIAPGYTEESNLYIPDIAACLQKGQWVRVPQALRYPEGI